MEPAKISTEFMDRLIKRAAKPPKTVNTFAATKGAKYNISQEEFEYILAKQGGVCAICFNVPDKGKVLHIDHCHTTGMIRGLLCTRCNSGLGFFRDNTQSLEAAVAYLNAAREKYSNATPEELERARACPTK